MFFLADFVTPDDAPTVHKVLPLAPSGMFLGRRITPPIVEVKVHVTSLRPPPDLWWLGPYLAISEQVLQILNDSGETFFELFPLRIVAKRQCSQFTMVVLNLLDNVPCLNRELSNYSLDEDGLVARIDRLVIDETQIPPERLLFRLGEKADLILARHVLVEQLQRSQVRGVQFHPVNTSP